MFDNSAQISVMLLLSGDMSFMSSILSHSINHLWVDVLVKIMIVPSRILIRGETYPIACFMIVYKYIS